MGANSLFENSLSDIDTANAIVDTHKAAFLDILRQMNLTELVHIFNSPANRRPANMASFLFGLRDNSIAAGAGVKSSALDFNFRLQEDEDFKIVFIIFYAAIIYHVGKLIAACNLELPRHLSFSGNGSRVLKIISPDVTLLTRLTRLMLEMSSGLAYGDRRLEILGLQEGASPKESTCKGGILATSEDTDTSDARRVVIIGDKRGVASSADTYATLSPDALAQIKAEVLDFYDFLDRVNEQMNFDDNFGVGKRALAIARQVGRLDLDTFLAKGIKRRLTESEIDDTIEESPFFYPILGSMNAISAEIGNSPLNSKL